MFDPLDWPTILLRLAAACGCAMVLGINREMRDKPAGFRTHMLVALGSATFMLTTLKMMVAVAARDQLATALDISRVIQGIAGGIGFLGAGSIVQSRGSVEGITTAAGIWVVGGVGVCCALGHFDIAAMATGFAFLITAVLGWVQGKLFPDRQEADTIHSPDAKQK